VAESAIHSIKPLLEKLSMFDEDLWDQHLLQAVNDYNNKPKKPYNLSPADLLFGRLAHEPNHKCSEEDAELMLNHLQKHHQLHEAIVAERITAGSDEVFSTYNLSKGEIVFFQANPKGKRENLQIRNLGPFVLLSIGRLGSCIVRLANGELRRTHASQIKGTGLIMTLSQEWTSPSPESQLIELTEDDLNLKLKPLEPDSDQGDDDYTPEVDDEEIDIDIPENDEELNQTLRRSPRLQAKRTHFIRRSPKAIYSGGRMIVREFTPQFGTSS
jgi:hypothetical protein